MRVLPLVASLLVLVGAAAAPAANPREERVELRPADVALAKRIAVRPSDLAGGWRRLAVPSTEGQQTTCPGFDPDLSRFTITGKAMSGYFQATGASVVSAVEVYRSRADAAGDFAAGTGPGVVRCLRHAFDQAAGGLARVTSARAVPAPRVGQRRAAYRIVAAVASPVATISLYLDVVVVQRGRSIVALFFTGVARPLPGRAHVAAAVAARMR